MHGKIQTNIEDNSGELIPESFRRPLAALTMWGGWLTGAALFVYSTLRYNPNEGHFAPQWVGFTFIGALFVGVAGTLVRSRMRLSDTIVRAMMAGVELSDKRQRQMVDELKNGDWR